MEEKQRICVTGAGGYVASWLVKLLLSKGYIVHGTVRDPCDEKNAHLKKLENAAENLRLFKTDLLNYEGLCDAISRCTGVFHVASPVRYGVIPNPEEEVIEPAVTGTRNVLNASLKARVQKVVVVSSIGAVWANPNWPKGQAMDESCWSDKDHCKATGKWYYLGKTFAEEEALLYGERDELNVVTVCLSTVVGPMLQPTLNASSLLLLTLLKGVQSSLEDKLRPVVDVRDVAEALLLTYSSQEAKGRYICSSYNIKMKDLAEKLWSLFPNYDKFPISFTEDEEDTKVNAEKLQKLGWRYRPLEETITDTVKNYESTGLLG